MRRTQTIDFPDRQTLSNGSLKLFKQQSRWPKKVT